MFASAWIILVALSLWISLVAFVWGLQTGQFSEQDRARYLPLVGEGPPPAVENPSRLPVEVYVLMSIGALGLAGMLASILLSFYRLKG